jgi:Uncharacterized protein conserved in bacteria (DUF2325)
MRIGVVGGVERLESQLKTVAGAAGHELEFHGGHMRGQGGGKLRALVERADLVVIQTDVNSHGAVIQARALARKAHRPVRLVRRLGPSALRALLN